jgi:hypothetical protein
MRIAIHPHYEPEPYRLPHQAMWFVILLLVLFMLAGKRVAASCDEDQLIRSISASSCRAGY